MSQKKKLLFVIESLTLAGSEKSLIALLSNLNPELYEIDLQLFQYGNELEKFIPDYVNVLPPLDYTVFSSKSWKNSLLEVIQKKKFSFLKAKLNYSLGLRTRKRNHSEIAKLYWEFLGNAFQISEKKYDVAIAFAQGVPTFYVIDKIRAKKKLTWVNANMQFTKHNKDFQESYYKQYDVIVPISEGTKEHLLNIFPHLADKYKVIPNIIDFSSIPQMANLYHAPMDTKSYRILTVGRLDDGMKGMDITIQACKQLRDKGLDFHWYILGKGPFRESMEAFIKEHQLENHLSLMGTTDNPYPYFKNADLYVQTSRHEGYGRTIAEARLLNLPIVTTRFDTVFMQMIHEKNGLVTDMNPEAVANAIERMMKDKDLYNAIVEYLKHEQKENLESVEKFDALIEELLGTN